MAFRNKGHNAFSCDVIDCSGGHPEWHIKQDVLPLLNGNCTFTTCDGAEHSISGKWDMIIAHPPCTYLTGAGACNIPKHPERIELGYDAAAFFLKCLNADCDKICVENPPPMKRFGLPRYNQLIRAYQIGENHCKAYCLWLKSLPPLAVDTTATKPTAEYQWTHKASGKKKTMSAFYNCGGKNHSKIRAKTPENLALAMAEQWG
jgi:hypothetical protein